MCRAAKSLVTIISLECVFSAQSQDSIAVCANLDDSPLLSIIKYLLVQLFNDFRTISTGRLSGRAVIPAKALFLDMYVNESVVANTAVTIAMVCQGLSHVPSTFSSWDRSHLQAIFFFLLFLFLFFFLFSFFFLFYFSFFFLHFFFF